MEVCMVGIILEKLAYRQNREYWGFPRCKNCELFYCFGGILLYYSPLFGPFCFVLFFFCVIRELRRFLHRGWTEYCNADFWSVRRLNSSSNFKVFGESILMKVLDMNISWRLYDNKRRWSHYPLLVIRVKKNYVELCRAFLDIYRKALKVKI